MIKQKIDKIAGIILEYSLYAVIFFIPISIAAIEAFFGIALTAFIVKKIINPDISFLKDRIYLVLLFFFFFNALSMVNSAGLLIKSLKALVFKWSEFVLMFMVFAESLNTRKRLRGIVLVVVFAAAVITLDGIFQRITGMDLFRHNLLSTTGYITASFKNQNSFSAYLAVLTLMLLSLLLMPYLQIRYKAGLGILTLLSGACLLMAHSRGAWLGFIAGLLLFLIISRNYKLSLTCLCVFMATILLIQPLRDRILSVFLYKVDGDRFKLLRTTWLMIKDHPILGQGIGTYMDHFNQYTSMNVTYYAHNSMMQMWAETGVFTLLSFLAFLAVLFVRAVKAFNKNRDYVLLGVFCGLFAFMAHSFLDNHLYALQLRTLFWSMSGILLALIRLPLINMNIKE